MDYNRNRPLRGQELEEDTHYQRTETVRGKILLEERNYKWTGTRKEGDYKRTQTM